MNLANTRVAVLALVLVPFLQGCVGAVAVGVGAGALMAADRRISEVYVTDEAIELRASGRINDTFGEKVHVNVTSYNRKVLLTGEVPDNATRSEIEKLVSSLDSVLGVINELRVGPISSFGDRSNDTYITSKVKTRFVDKGFLASHVKVVTEARVVYLLGLVTKSEGDPAVAVARTTSDVAKVVRVFEYLPVEEAKRLDTRPPEQQPPATR
jgi:osmotically-inducible protein OsmY